MGEEHYRGPPAPASSNRAAVASPLDGMRGGERRGVGATKIGERPPGR
jgi:hypothetical protein